MMIRSHRQIYSRVAALKNIRCSEPGGLPHRIRQTDMGETLIPFATIAPVDRLRARGVVTEDAREIAQAIAEAGAAPIKRHVLPIPAKVFSSVRLIFGSEQRQRQLLIDDFGEASFKFGRHRTNHFIFGSETVSRRHGSLYLKAGRLYLKDRSLHGTRLSFGGSGAWFDRCNADEHLPLHGVMINVLDQLLMSVHLDREGHLTLRLDRHQSDLVVRPDRLQQAAFAIQKVTPHSGVLGISLASLDPAAAEAPREVDDPVVEYKKPPRPKENPSAGTDDPPTSV